MLITWGANVAECLKYVNLINSGELSDYNYKNAEPKAIVNCLKFGNPSDTMGDFSDVIDNITKDCIEYNIPIIGGNVSLYNATDNVSIKPSPVLLMVSIIE